MVNLLFKKLNYNKNILYISKIKYFIICNCINNSFCMQNFNNNTNNSISRMNTNDSISMINANNSINMMNNNTNCSINMMNNRIRRMNAHNRVRSRNSSVDNDRIHNNTSTTYIHSGNIIDITDYELTISERILSNFICYINNENNIDIKKFMQNIISNYKNYDSTIEYNIEKKFIKFKLNYYGGNDDNNFITFNTEKNIFEFSNKNQMYYALLYFAIISFKKLNLYYTEDNEETKNILKLLKSLQNEKLANPNNENVIEKITNILNTRLIFKSFVMNKLNKSTTGSVYKVTFLDINSKDKYIKINKEKYTIKLFNSEALRKSNEIKFIHENISRQLENEILLTNASYSVHNYYQFEDLYKFRKLCNNNISWTSITYIAGQLIECINELYKRNILILDFNPDNICIGGSLTPKIINSTILPDNCKYGGTIPFIAPEIILKKCTDYSKIYIWELGMFMYVLHYGKYPYNITTAKIKETNKEHDKVRDLYKNMKNYELEFSKETPDFLIDFLAKSLEIDPEKRMSINECTKHILFSKIYELIKDEKEKINNNEKFILDSYNDSLLINID